MKNKMFLTVVIGFFLFAFSVGFLTMFFDTTTALDEKLSEVNKKIYFEEEKIVELKTKKGTNIAQIELLTPLINNVGYGMQRVAEYKVDGNIDYDNFYGEIKTYNKNEYDEKLKEATSLNREFELKYKTNETYFIPIYDCSDNKTGCIQVDEKQSIRETWLPFDEKVKLKKDDSHIIGLYTYVEDGDYVEWIPSFAGVEVDEWAVWNATLDANLDMYLAFEEATVAGLIDATGNYSFSNGGTEPTMQATGKIGYAVDFNNVASTWINANATTPISGAEDRSVSFWTYLDTCSDADALTSITPNSGYDWFNVVEGVGGGTNYWGLRLDSGGTSVESNATCSTGSWVHIAVTYDGTNLKLYENGVLKLANTQTTTTTASGYYRIGGHPFDTGREIDGKIDELGWWTRALTYADVQHLYNSGSGITWADQNCGFSGYVFDGSSNALENANVTIWNMDDIDEYYETQTDSNGYWIVNITNSTQTYMVGVYFNDSLPGQLKPYIPSTC